MKKTILSLAAVFAISAIAPTIYAAPVVDSSPYVFVDKYSSPVPKPTIDFSYQSKVTCNDIGFYDVYGDSGKSVEIISYSLKPGERKVVRYFKLLKGQELSICLWKYGVAFAGGGTLFHNPEKKDIKKIIADKDGYYLVDISVPNSNVKEYRFSTMYSID